ncbi:exocyst complex component 3-like protein [Cyrtonyx montezumae]|uniref:exocyst complex component 3-like protein n=1 Tax=Cyrtonyx montezumae TaxID=9017 RepID=UPI0032DBB3CA
MKKVKRSCKALMGRGHKQEKGAGENARMLPEAKEREKQEKKWLKKLKRPFSNLVEIPSNRKKAAAKKDKSKNVAENLLQMETRRKEEEGEMSAEEVIHRFTEQGKFSQACLYISHLEQSENDDVRDFESLYTLLAEQMWSAMREALSESDGMLLQPLQSVGESLKWQKQKKEEWLSSEQGMEPASTWHPNFWGKDLEKELTQYWIAQIPHFIATDETDETALKQHLSQLETTFLQHLEHRSGSFEKAGLLIPYAQCCCASLSSHLSALIDSEHCTFSQVLLVYEWCLKAYRRSSGMCLGSRQSSQHTDVESLLRIILKAEEKLLAVAQKEVGTALNEAFDTGKTPCAGAAVIQILTAKTKAAQGISERLREKVEAVCLEECLSFLDSYENKVRSVLQHDDFCGNSSSLQIFENICILRTVWCKLTYLCSASTDQDVKVKEFLDKMEDKIKKHFLWTVTSQVKGTLKNHFRKSDSGFRHDIEFLKESFLVFGKGKTDKYQALVNSVNNIIANEYMQALLTTSRKSSVKRRQIVSKMEEDHRMLHTTFKECLAPTADALKDPIKTILELIQTPDAEGMKIALLPMLRQFPDLREEHLNAVLDIKGPICQEDRNALLKIFHDSKKTETEGNLLFEDIEVKRRMYKCCCCFCC